MNISSNTVTRAALVIASGLALALAFPKSDVSLLAWVAFVPFFYAVEGEPLKRVFWWGWLQGLACYVGSLYWVVITLNEFAGVNFVLSLIPMLLLAGVIGIFTAISMWTGEFCARRLRIPIAVTMPIAWAAVELLRTYFPIGFPWNLLGETQYRNLDLIQFAEFTGTYGISALIIFFNVVIFMILLRRGSRRLQTISLSLLTAAMIGAIVFGNWRIHELKSLQPDGSFRVAMVQGNIPQSVKWDPGALAPTFKIYSDQSTQGAKEGADLIVWPEAAATFIFQPDDRYPASLADDANYRNALLKLARDIGKPILFGAPALVVKGDRVTGFANRAYLVSAQGEVAAWYDKIQLVPFGEYVPFRALLGYFVNRIVHGMGDMVPGEQQTLFNLNGAKLSVLICYESIFPDLARRSVKEGADVMVNITN
ncbi:MAG TPA: apolipoprotein N-acyltransferase, partial [Candidatus Binataceae bacterium]|nr:apolipoprotein N-acyltransferase [Candidatus Binataceae bacterium]